MGQLGSFHIYGIYMVCGSYAVDRLSPSPRSPYFTDEKETSPPRLACDSLVNIVIHCNPCKFGRQLQFNVGCSLWQDLV